MKNLAKLLGIASEKDTQEQILNDDAVKVVDHINEVHMVAVEEIVPNPFQPRKTFHDESLTELAASIKEHGIIQPLLVRRADSGYELIAGERRLRASKLIELATVPVIIKELNDREMAELAMIENLQREDLHFLEEAEGYQHLISSFGLTQEELAVRVGKNQSTIANKLRLLKLQPEIRDVLIKEKLTERHARALLKFDDEQKRKEILQTVVEQKLNVRQTEQLIEETLETISREMTKNKKPKQNIVKVIKDVRIFINTINHVVSEMKKTGLKIKMKQTQDDDYVHITLQIPKRGKK